jgi:hypothetical protein
MAARRRHRDLRLELADETQLRGGSDPSPSFATRVASPGLSQSREPSEQEADSISQSEQKVVHHLDEALTATTRAAGASAAPFGRRNHSQRPMRESLPRSEQRLNPIVEAVRRGR